MNVPYYKQLLAIREIFEQTSTRFPLKGCQNASKAISVLIGLEEVAGFYYFEKHNDWHSWNYDKKRGLYIDITADQYPNTKEKIIITSNKDPKYKKTNSRTLEHKKQNIDLEIILDYFF